jgi:hypothetical protein
MSRKILLGLHDLDYRRIIRRSCERNGYEVDVGEDPEALLSRARKGDYKRYLMDINFGCPGEAFTDPAKEIFGAVKERVERGEAKFIAISGNDDAVELAVKDGIPSISNVGFSLRDFLK